MSQKPEIIFQRKITDELKKWKRTSNGEKALLIEGAKRIGKSVIVEEFAKREYKSYILIDFNTASDVVKGIFYKYLDDLDNFFMILSASTGKTLYKRESLIIFDEIQKFPKAREAIKYLVLDGRYDYIETGSLISIKENVKNITVPSEERKITMFPLDFEEFAWALGEKNLIEYIKNCYEKRIPLEKGMHDKAMLLFRQYMLVGGMPKPLCKFILEGKQFKQCDLEKRDILSNYRDDIAKIDGKYKAKVLSIFDAIPGFLSSHEKRVKLNSIGVDGKYPLYSDTFFWLSDSMICNECFGCDDPNIGLILNENRSSIKCYMGDTGLLVSHAFHEKELINLKIYDKILSGKLSINKGMLYENIIAQMLVANGHKLYFYTHYDEFSKKNDIEIDFLLTNESKTNLKITPIEVKSSKNYSTDSFDKFSQRFSSRIGEKIIIHPKPFRVRDDGVICLPAYMAFLL